MSYEFASLQLTLVDRFVELGLDSYSNAVHRLTNFQRRLGLGPPADPPANPEWLRILHRLDQATSHHERSKFVMAAYDSLPPAIPEHVAQSWLTIGAFSIQVEGRIARTHFYATDEDSSSPLLPAKRDARRSELMGVLAQARREHPEIERVSGGSWLYTTSSYRSLFPDEHMATAVVRRNRQTFRGMSHWGQFLDHQWNLRLELAEEFRDRCRAWTGGDLCELFPIDTLEVSSPIEAFGLG